MEKAGTEKNQNIDNDEMSASSTVWFEYVGRHKHLQFTDPNGVWQNLAPEMSSCRETTNRFAEYTLASNDVKPVRK